MCYQETKSKPVYSDSCRATLLRVKMRPRPSEITTGCCSAFVNTSIMLCCMGEGLNLKEFQLFTPIIFCSLFSCIIVVVVVVIHCTSYAAYLQAAGHFFWILGPRTSLHQKRGCPTDG